MKRVSSIVAALLVAAALVAPAASAAPGEFDPSFGIGGSERIFPSPETIAFRGVTTQSDGRIVLAGGDQTSKGIVVVRLLPNGAADPSFGTGGVVITTVPGGFAEGRAVAIQPDGKIVVVGQGQGVVNSDFIAVRYDANGNPDPSFGGGDGIETIPVGADQDRAEAVAIGANERILLTGEARAGANVEAGVVVLQTGGKPDAAFGVNGVKLLNTTGASKEDQGKAIVGQADGKIVIADETGPVANAGFTTVRLLPNGELDPGFGGTGVVNTAIPGSTAKGAAADVLVQPDGRIVTTGHGFDGSGMEADYKFAAVRYLTDGKPDPSFGGAGTGIFSQQISPGTESAERVALTPNGKLVLAGIYSPKPNDRSFAVMRLDSAGVPDPTFGTGGLTLRGATAPFGNIFEEAALDARERVVVVSRDFIGGGNTEVEVSRILGDLPPEQPPVTQPTTSLSPPQYTPMPLAKPPHARMNAVPRKLNGTKLTGFSGTAASTGGGQVAKVQIALVKAASSKAGSAASCQELKNAKGQFKSVKAVRGNCPLLWLNASGTAKWSFKLKTVLPPGRYVVYSRALDASGLAEESFSRAAGNRFAFRLLAPEPPSIRNP